MASLFMLQRRTPAASLPCPLVASDENPSLRSGELRSLAVSFAAVFLPPDPPPSLALQDNEEALRYWGEETSSKKLTKFRFTPKSGRTRPAAGPASFGAPSRNLPFSTGLSDPFWGRPPEAAPKPRRLPPGELVELRSANLTPGSAALRQALALRARSARC